MDLPATKMSGSNPHAVVAPPQPAEKVWVSSIISSAPYFVANSRRPAMKPGSGSTMPILVSAGSVRIAATSPCCNAASTEARSFHTAARVVRSTGTGGATLPGRETVDPSGPASAKASSTDP